MDPENKERLWRFPRHLLGPHVNAGGPAIQQRGAMNVIVVERKQVREMLYASERGHYTAAKVRIAIGLWLERTQPNTQHCALCSRIFSHPAEVEAFFIAMPMIGDGDSLVAAVCNACVRKHGGERLVTAAIEHFRKIWPASTVTGIR